ncbi:MAG: hypothetical protein L0332_34425 [Chloroflexi bacterium]|nr:hypothetical protein [Chloroflexota bacterium]MCI0575250.1 hypothetical protein [Chloroflexota bacterium]MCI0645696.1 hypothetical protein [Chloroflexota bacterium]MCI0731791.1 hypothetical protein [Chloroflexota bacterium]
MTASLRPRQQRRAYLQAILNLKSSNYERVAAWINLMDTLIPGFARRVSAGLTNSSRFPFASAEVQLMSYGSGATVFLIKRPDGDWVLKIYRRSLGKQAHSLAQIAQFFKVKYETVCAWYNGRFNLVPLAHFLILHGPIFGSPAAGVLQSYIHGEKKDFFQDCSNADLLHLMCTHEGLRAQFLFFTERTLDIYQQHGLCVDFLGRENLMLVNDGGRWQLLVVDNGIFNLESLRRSAPAVYGQLTARLERVSYLQRELT